MGFVKPAGLERQSQGAPELQLPVARPGSSGKRGRNHKEHAVKVNTSKIELTGPIQKHKSL